MKSSLALVAFGATTLAFSLSTAHASGFLADTFIRPFSPQLADAADDWNRRAGHPVEAAVSAAADAYVPGSGAALQGAWAIQRQVQNAGSTGQRLGAPQPGFTPVVTYGGARPNGRQVAAPTYGQPSYNQSAGMAVVCRAGMYFATNRGAGPVGAPCGMIMDPMGGVWPGFYSPN